ncbi:MAG TPA: DUF3866 family protein, partial [Capsulimonadaceae bacterium]|nr:DUF3866 family protein [Capsulimonadaceae bacterium]
DLQELVVKHMSEPESTALNYVQLSGPVSVGDPVLLNSTARWLNLGTGGYDFVLANLNEDTWLGDTNDTNEEDRLAGHIMKCRYLPCQRAVLTLEEQSEYAGVWEWELDGLPVIVGQLHSQIAPIAAGLKLRGKKVAYIMTDGAALPLAFSRLARQLKAAGLIDSTLTCGQAFGGDYETVTVHSALLAVRYILKMDAAIVCQGPGNAGTATRYGFSGIEQATLLGTAKALEGKPVAVVRMSEFDERDRHRGISHHTKTALDLTYARCIVPLPMGASIQGLPPGHDIRFVDDVHEALDLLNEKGIEITTMGRGVNDDPAFFAASAAAGMVDV